MKLLINYSDKNFTKAQQLNTTTGYEIAGFDKVIEYSPDDIDSEFKEKNKKILGYSRGGGYWLWKPYIIRKALDLIGEADYLFYADSGSIFVNSIDPLIELQKREKQDIIPFELRFMEKQYTKRDALVLMDCDEPKYTESFQRLAGYNLIKKTDFSTRFINEFLNFACDERIITDKLNSCGLEEYPEFIEHRHDLSIFSLLTKKYGLKAFRDPSQFGKGLENLYPDSDYPMILESTRKSNSRIKRSMIKRIEKIMWHIKNKF
ncbi:MAG: hypothetical protein NT007_12305 [Candidatus Kapabacteria bacterium]|nr:hypothetical protein [Candidatus Kapabacteria bacterium]